jgi:putative membrane-bound dehydrogenase-like protein
MLLTPIRLYCFFLFMLLQKQRHVISINRHIFSLHACWPFVMIVALFSCSGDMQKDQPLPTESALASFEIEEGFKIELVAAEPFIGDPVDMEIDEYGRLLVVEMPGYPLDKSGTGKIKLLSDEDGDGRMDKSVTFAENLVLPNSIMRWKNGFLVTDAPNVLYLEDSDNNGQADVRDTVLTGFALSNPQHNLNSPVLGIDNWIYLAHEGAVSTETYIEEFGDEGREIHYPHRPGGTRLSKNANGRSVRFQPDHFKLELLSSHTQFGHTFDQWGNYLLVGNANHIYQEIIPEGYLERNPALLLSNTTHSLSDHGNAAEVFPITENPQHQLLTDVGVITSACGLTAYLGDAFPPMYNEQVTFVAEPVSNLIHADKLVPDGATFKATRMKPYREFLASKDAKFRPVNLYVGPDGALYVVDYYRQIIEHPEWMGNEVIASGTLYNDTDKGRIYRVSAKEAKPIDWTRGLKLGDASDEDLVNYLASGNFWWRYHAQRLLVDRKTKTSLVYLNKMLDHISPMGRLHALWTLEGMGGLKVNHIEKALRDSVAGIRVNAVKLSELHIKEFPQLKSMLLRLRSDEDAKVRFQLLLTLGSIYTPASDEARQQLLFRDIGDKWVQVAALTSSGNLNPLLETTLKKFPKDTPAAYAFVERLTAMITAQRPTSVAELLTRYATGAETKNQPTIHAALLEGIAQGLQNNRSAVSPLESEQNIVIQTFFETSHTEVRKAATRVLKAIHKKSQPLVGKALSRARAIAMDSTQSDIKRADAVDFLSIDPPTKYVADLRKLFVAQEPLAIQLASLRTWSVIPDASLADYLVNNWQSLTPEIQDAAINTFLTNRERMDILLTAIEKNRIASAAVSWPRRVRLMAYNDDNIRNRARAIFVDTREKKAPDTYAGVLNLTGDIGRGKVVYQQHCGLCHQIRGKMGMSIGPDLGTIHNWSVDAIMNNILSPNASISSGYDLWSAGLQNGETVQGIIASETSSAITFRNVGTNDKTINRNNIKSLKALNMSIMPMGLEKQITPQQMADLLAFLKENK